MSIKLSGGSNIFPWSFLLLILVDFMAFGISWSLTPGCASSSSSRLIAFRCLGIFAGF